VRGSGGTKAPHIYVPNIVQEKLKKQKTFFTDNDDPIDIRYDNVFKAVFTRDSPASKGALSKLVSALIGKEVTILAICANEPPINSLRDRQIRFDINCKAENGELINVEMSFNPTPFEPVRLEFHTGKLFTGQDIKGSEKSYDNLKEVYQITILAKERFFPDEDFYHSFEYYDKTRRISLKGKTRIITLELSKVEKIVDKPIEEMSTAEMWGVFFRYLTDKKKRNKINEILEIEEGIAMASETLITITKDDIERSRKLSELKYELDIQSMMTYAKQTGRKEGRQEGRLEGKQAIIDLLKSGKLPEDIIKDYESSEMHAP
jgi:predicted transposase/invertase (TIGR01784 family)